MIAVTANRPSDAVAVLSPDEALGVELAVQYPLGVRVLPDGSIAALQDLLFTRAILLGCTAWGHARRFCFADRALAAQRFAELQGEDDEPQGFTARRPELRQAAGVATA